MAVETVYENQDTISPRLNKQYTTVVDLGTVTVWYDRLKERLSEHADHIKTLGQFIRTPPPPPPKKKNTKKKPHTKRHPFQTKPVCQSLSVKNCCLTLHSVSGKLFFSVCNQEIPIRYIRWGGPEEHASFLCVWRTGSIHDFLLGTLPEPATVITSNRI